MSEESQKTTIAECLSLKQQKLESWFQHLLVMRSARIWGHTTENPKIVCPPKRDYGSSLRLRPQNENTAVSRSAKGDSELRMKVKDLTVYKERSVPKTGLRTSEGLRVYTPG